MARRSQLITLSLGNNTTANFFGNSTTGGVKFPQAAKIEAASLHFLANKSTTNVKQLGIRLRKNASTIVAVLYGSGVKPWRTTGPTKKALTLSATDRVNFTTTDRFWVQITNITASTTSISLVLRVKM